MKSVFILLHADEGLYGADYIMGAFSTLEAAQEASGEKDEWKHNIETNTWHSGWCGIEEHTIDVITRSG